MRFPLMALAVFLTVALPSAAEDAYPDMLGTWTGTAQRVISNDDGSSDFDTYSITIEFTEQRDRRFVGWLLDSGLEIKIIGIFLTRDTFRWAERDGFADARLDHPDSFEACFVRTAEFSKVAACEVLTREN